MYDLIIIGAGPAGLSCAIAARRARLSSVILEKGSVVDYLRRFPTYLTWFSTPELLEIGDIPFPIVSVRPTRAEVLAYYHRVCSYYKLDVRHHDSVESLRRIDGRFQVRTQKGSTYGAQFVAVATGYFDNPNRLGVDGESLAHVFHYYKEPFEFYGCDVAVVGGRNSAVEAALDLYRHGARVTLVHRGEKLSDGVKYWILPDIENRIKAGEIKAMFRSTICEIRNGSIVLSTQEGHHELKTDFVFVLIGFSPDTKLLRSFGVEINAETLAPHHDEKTFETNIPGLYVAGSVVAGKFNNKVFVENGRHHGSVIVASILSKLGRKQTEFH
jgi:thioredoxin reductase (NADPH)